jgi:predicted nucleic acid-binding protein
MKKKVYLFDTDIASAFFDVRSGSHQKALAFVQSASARGERIFISCIALSEIRYGLALYQTLDKSRTSEVEKSLRAFRGIRDIEKGTSAHYAGIRAGLMRKYCPTDVKGLYKTVRPESLIDKTTSEKLGIQENDLWLASIAVQHRMTLVSQDKMNRIKDVCPSLKWVTWK